MKIRIYNPSEIGRIGFVDKTKEPFIEIKCTEYRELPERKNGNESTS